jgi:hypothetical protein
LIRGVLVGGIAGMMAVQSVVVLLYFTETKQVALEDMQAAIQ